MNVAVFFAGLMEVAKLALIASYIFLALGASYPLLPAAAGLFAALLLGAYQRRRGGLVLFRILGHAAGIAAVFTLTAKSYKGADSTVATFLLGAGAFAFWLRGAHLGDRSFGHERCVARFDEGVGLFLFALSLTAVIGVGNPEVGRLTALFFVSSAAALGVSKNSGLRRGGFSRRSGGALALPAAAAILLGAAALAALVPLLFAPAARAGDALKTAFDAVEPYLGAFIRWLFGFGRGRGAAAASESSGGDAMPPPAPVQDDPLARLIARIALWGLGGIVAVLLAGLAVYGLAKLVRWLSTRVEGGSPFDAAVLPAWLRRILSRAARALSAAADRIDAFIRARRAVRSPAAAAYLRLLRGARFAGVPRRPAETPREFARRLETAFPRAAKDAAFIVGELEKEAYGGRPPERDTTARIRAAGGRARASAFALERIRCVFDRRA